MKLNEIVDTLLVAEHPSEEELEKSIELLAGTCNRDTLVRVYQKIKKEYDYEVAKL